MKLTNEQIEKLSHLIGKSLIEKELININVETKVFINKIKEIIFDDLKVEDDLNKEANEILKNYEKDIDYGNLDSHKMFNLIKAKLVEDRKLIL